MFDPFCPACSEPLLYPFEARKKNFHLEHESPLERFLDFLPLSEIDIRLDLGAGGTPLLRLPNLEARLKSPILFAKNEALNPTGSFKDRGSAVAVQKAVFLGIRRIGTVSTGNMASSTAAFGARAGLETFIFVKEDTSPEKLAAAAVYGPFLVAVEGDYGALFSQSFELGRRHQIYFANSIDPHRIEGYKLTAFEIFLQLGRQAPDYILVPLSSGGHLLGLMKAFLELKKLGWIAEVPVFVGVQAEGCAPLAQAFAAGDETFIRLSKAETIAQAISNPNPPAGNIVLRWIRDNDGKILAVSDQDILSAQKILAEAEGLSVLPASATTLAGFIQLSRTISFAPEDRVVLVPTGTGLKSLTADDLSRTKIPRTSLENLENTLLETLQCPRLV